MLRLTLRGTPTIYYGEEIGMMDTPIPPELVQDPAEKNQPGIGQGRDPERTPMPWDASPKAGFTTGMPWLPLGEHAAINVASEGADPHSTLALYRALLRLRRERSELVGGAISGVRAESTVLRYERGSGTERIIVALNLGSEEREIALEPGRVLLSTHLDRGGQAGARAALRANEGMVIALGERAPDE